MDLHYVLESSSRIPSSPRIRDGGARGGTSSLDAMEIVKGQQVEDEPCDYIIRGTPGGTPFWDNEVKLYEHHVDKLFAMFWHKKSKIKYYLCTINKTFAKPGQHMVEYTSDKLQEHIQEDDDTLPVKLGDDTVSCDSRFMLGTDKRATITMNWSWFRHHANMQEEAQGRASAEPTALVSI